MPKFGAFRTTAPAGSMVFVPTGSAVVERTLGDQLAYGWRLSLLEDTKAAEGLRALLAAHSFLPEGNILRETMEEALSDIESFQG
eukprot:2327675-Alexandrium_andersonii.AAC.1